MSPVLKFFGLGRASKTARGAQMARVPAGWAHVDGKRRWVWGFEIDLRPVSNADWLQFMQATAAKAPRSSCRRRLSPGGTAA